MASDRPPRTILVGISPPPRPATSPMEFFLGPIPNMAAGGGQSAAGERLLQRHRMVDPHAPPKVRVNAPLSQLESFAQAFNCPADAPMRVRPACEVW
jgi:hypothetical protein